MWSHQRAKKLCSMLRIGVYRIRVIRMGAERLHEYFQLTSLFTYSLCDLRLRLLGWREKGNAVNLSFTGTTLWGNNVVICSLVSWKQSEVDQRTNCVAIQTLKGKIQCIMINFTLSIDICGRKPNLKGSNLLNMLDFMRKFKSNMNGNAFNVFRKTYLT